MATTIQQNKVRILVLGLSAVAVTLCVGFLLKSDETAAPRFWMTWAPVLVGEVLVGATAFKAVGEGREKISRRAALSVVPVAYLAFTLVLAAAGGIIESDALFGVLQAVGLLAALFLVTTSTMAAEASERDEKATKQSLAARSSWRLDLEDAAAAASNAFPGNADVAKALADAAEKARFSPETLAGREDLDEPVHAAVQTLCKAAEGTDPAAVLAAARAFRQAADARARRVRAAR